MRRLINLRGGASVLICAAVAGFYAQIPTTATAQVPPAPAQAQQTGPQAAPQARGIIPKFATRQILDDLYQIASGGNMVCMYVLVGRDKALAVDTHFILEYDGVKITDMVKAITGKPLIVVNRHSRGDHTMANVQFGEVYAPPVAVEELKAAAAGTGKELRYVLNPVKNGHLFDLGDRQIEVIEIPAHSAGSIALLDRKTGCLFTGDEIEGGQVVGIHQDNIKKHMDNMRMLYEKYFDKIIHRVPAHNGAPLTKRYVKYFMDLDA